MLSNEFVQIQAQDRSGMWRTYVWTPNNQQRITQEMNSLKKQFPHFKIRTINKDGRLIDMMM